MNLKSQNMCQKYNVKGVKSVTRNQTLVDNPMYLILEVEKGSERVI